MSRELTIGCALLAAAVSACDAPRPTGWRNQPIPIHLVDGIPAIDLYFAGDGPYLAAIDTASPLTVISTRAPALREGELRLVDALRPEVTRFIFHEQPVFGTRVEPLGLHEPVPVRALLGWSVLSRFSVHLDYGAEPTLTFRDNIPDHDVELASDCDTTHLLVGGPPTTPCAAVVPSVPAGGGAGRFGDEDIEIPATRMTLPLCLMPAVVDPKAAKPAELGPTGQAATALLSTGLGTSVIARSAFERLRALYPQLEATPGHTLHLPYGSEPVELVQIPNLAVVASVTRELGPCAELARRQRLLLAPREGILEQDRDHSGASTALLTVPTEFAVIDDDAPFIVGLRTELFPVHADVDVVLGGSFLARFRVDVDYPANRVLLECDETLGAESCRVIPFCAIEGQDGPKCL